MSCCVLWLTLRCSVLVQQLVRQGKRVLLTSRTNYGKAMNSTFWNHSFCGWDEPDVNDIDARTCVADGVATMTGE